MIFMSQSMIEFWGGYHEIHAFAQFWASQSWFINGSYLDPDE